MDTTITVRRAVAVSLARKGAINIPTQRGWRPDDPPAKTIGELGPEDMGRRVVIRSRDFLGTVVGTLLESHPHPSLVHFSCVQLLGKRPLTFRNDTDVIVVDELKPRNNVVN